MAGPLTEARVGDLTVSCQNDAHFARLRTALGYDSWLLDALASFDWGRMAAGGGKGGNKMARTPCKRLFVKEVSGGDEQTLSSTAFLEAYVSRVSTRSSLVVHLLLHFTRPDGQTCVVMNNWLPTQPGITWSRLYDLKGTADDKVLLQDGQPVPEAHKRWFNVPWLLAECTCGAGAVATPERRRKYALGKKEAFSARFHVTARQREALLASLRDDVAFLTSQAACGGLMDYSVILGVATFPLDQPSGLAAAYAPFTLGCGHAAPVAAVHGGQVHVYYLGVIDFLQAWTGGKKVAHVIKAVFAPHPISTVPPPAYGAQFLRHFEQALVADGQDLPASMPQPAEAPPPAPASSRTDEFYDAQEDEA